MTSNYREPEEGGGFNPLDDKVNEKPYTRLNVTANAEELNRPIPEPGFTPPPMNEAPKGESSSNSGKGNGAPPADPFNPSMNDIPSAEKSKASEHMAIMIMKGYEFVNQLANKGLMFSEKRLMKLQQEGEIDFKNTYIPYDINGNTMSAVEFIKEYNSQQENAFAVSEEFKQEATPVLKRVLEKRGAGMTDEQYLIFLFGSDIAMKGMHFVSARAQMNQMILLMKEYSTHGGAGAPPRSAPVYDEPQPQQTYSQPEYVPGEENVYVPDEDVAVPIVPEGAETVNDIVERMTNPQPNATASKPAGAKRGRKPKNRK
jgi:hypothetical protein